MGGHAHLLVGALVHSDRWRAVLAGSEDFPHLVQALDDVVRKLGGTARRWRFAVSVVMAGAAQVALCDEGKSPLTTGSASSSASA